MPPESSKPEGRRVDWPRRLADRDRAFGLPPHRVVDDPKALRALAHPTRIALLEALTLRETLTATQASEIVGESPTNCAFHLRTLARYGLVVEAEGGRGRERPWRVAQTGLTLTHEGEERPAVRHAANLAATQFYERWFDRAREYAANAEFYPREIDSVTTQSETLWWVTVDEMRALRDEIYELMQRFRERTDPTRRPAGALPFEGIVMTHPLFDPPHGDEAPER